MDIILGGLAILSFIIAYYLDAGFWDYVLLLVSILIVIGIIDTIKEKFYKNKEIKEFKQYISKLDLKEQLILSLVGTDVKYSKQIQNFGQLLNNDLINFYYRVGIHTPDAIRDLIEVEKRLKKVDTFPKFLGKRMIAIGGGFSAGKSQFLISLLRDSNLKLPTNIKPTTAIPTYVIHDEKSALYGMGEKGNAINLTEFDPKIGEKINHNFIQAFGFNLKSIMPYMVMTNQLAYENLCFIDTPGYNPSSSKDSYTNEDRTEANKFIQNSEALIWLVPITAGTIPQSDLDFLEEVVAENKPLYIVLNKADQRPAGERKKIINEVQEKLNEHGIEYEGISVYSSSMQKEFSFKEKSLSNFLANNNYLSWETDHIIDEAVQLLVDAVKEKNKNNQEFRDKLTEIRKILVSDFKSNHEDIIDELLSKIDNKDNLPELNTIIDKLKEEIASLYLSYNNSEK